MNSTTMTNNPLLQKNVLPKFDKILPQHFKPALVKLIKKNQLKIKQLLSLKKFTWNNLIEPLEALHEQLLFRWNTINHLNAVVGTPKIRKAYEKCLPLVTKYAVATSQHSGIYQAFKQIEQSKEYHLLDRVQKKIVKDKLRDLVLAGVNLPTKKRKSLMQLKQKLALLSNQFAENVLDATQTYSIILTEKATKGLPKHLLALGRANAQKKHLPGWQFSLDQSSYQTLITFADSRNLRKKIYTAYVTRASDTNRSNPKWDNTKIIEEILSSRARLAKILSFKNYAEYSLATKMAKTTKQVVDFLDELAQKSMATGKKEMRELEQFAKKSGIKELRPWDLAYYEEKLKQKKFKLSEEELRHYFPEDQVLKGIFKIAKLVYGITIKEQTQVSLWHPDVRFFAVYDQQRKLQGRFYLDLYSRENKSSGAWMDNCQTRELLNHGTILPPTAYLVCNFSPPIDQQPGLLTHNDVITLLHEFGHALQHLLTKVNYLAVSGIKGVPWDAVELASQFMENWGWQKESIALMSKHYQTTAPLPKKLLQNLLASRTHHSALAMLRQLELALIDFTLHLKSPAPTTTPIKKIISQVQKQTRVTPIYQPARILHTFLHIFTGDDSYAAGYYSYKWAELLAVDAFSKFKEQGIFDPHTGRTFLHLILESGGSEDPMVLFKQFRQRAPKIDALLLHYGINPKTQSRSSYGSKSTKKSGR